MVLPAAATLSKANTTQNLILHRLRFRPLLLSRDQHAGSALMPHPFLRTSPAAIPGRGAGLGERSGCVWFSCSLRDVISFLAVGAVLSPVEGVSTFFWFLCYIAAATDRYSPFSSLPPYLRDNIGRAGAPWPADDPTGVTSLWPSASSPHLLPTVLPSPSLVVLSLPYTNVWKSGNGNPPHHLCSGSLCNPAPLSPDPTETVPSEVAKDLF